MSTPAAVNPLRRQVVKLYKKLIYISRDYPSSDGTDAGSKRLRAYIHKSFKENESLADEEEIRRAIISGNMLYKEVEGLIQLKKYRFLKKAYSDEKSKFTQDELDELLKKHNK